MQAVDQQVDGQGHEAEQGQLQDVQSEPPIRIVNDDVESRLCAARGWMPDLQDPQHERCAEQNQPAKQRPPTVHESYTPSCDLDSRGFAARVAWLWNCSPFPSLRRTHIAAITVPTRISIPLSPARYWLTITGDDVAVNAARVRQAALCTECPSEAGHTLPV